MPSRPTVRRWGSFPTTADVGIWARAPTPAGLLEALGLALYARFTDLRSVRPSEQRLVSASGPDPASLVVAFLGELLLLEQTDGFLGRRIAVRLVGSPPTAILATVEGERFDGSRHRSGVEVKAITLHQIEADFERGHARVILDI